MTKEEIKKRVGSEERGSKLIDVFVWIEGGVS